MTAICGGGTSAPDPALDIALTFGSGRMIQLLAARGLSSFSVALPLIGTLPVILSSFCASDPPAMTALTSDEANALLQLRFGPDLASGLGKLRDIVLNLIWMECCRCTSGTLTEPTLPSTPTDAPVFVPPSYDPGPPVAGAWYPMTRLATKVLTLGGGTPARPTGWFLPAFDDSGWNTGVAPAGLSATWASRTGFFGGVAAGANPALPGNVEAVAPASPIANNYEQFLVRWWVYIGDERPADAILRRGSLSQAGPGWGSGAIYNGGGVNVAPPGALDSQFIVQRIVPNAWNLFAFDVNPSNTGNANTWGTEGGIYFGLDFTLGRRNPNVTPCCPPDVTTQSYLDSILAMVTLIQRQSAPFSYVYGTNHTGLTGNGAFDVAGVLGVSVDVTSLPSSYGRAAGEPEQLFDLGYVTLGTADGYDSSRRIDHDGCLVLPGKGGVYTSVGYTLAPGVTVDIRELLREP